LNVNGAFVGAFAVRDFMITNTHIRTTKDLSDIYHRMYIKNQGWRYEGLVDLENFPFDYDYEIYNGPDHPPEVMNDVASNLPQYLLDMREEVQRTYDVLDAALNSTLEDMLNGSFSQLYIARPTVRALYGNDMVRLRLNLTYHFGSFLFNNSFVHVRHPISKDSGNYSVRMRLNHSASCIQDITSLLRAHNASEATIGELEGRGV
jgi:hypothetical protein